MDQQEALNLWFIMVDKRKRMHEKLPLPEKAARVKTVSNQELQDAPPHDAPPQDAPPQDPEIAGETEEHIELQPSMQQDSDQDRQVGEVQQDTEDAHGQNPARQDTVYLTNVDANIEVPFRGNNVEENEINEPNANVHLRTMATKKQRKKKGKNDERLKKTASSYLLFSVEARKTIVNETPGMNLGQISKRCGELWREMEEAQKSEWKMKAVQLKTDSTAGAPPPPSKPKRPPSSYLVFAMEHRKKIILDTPGIGMTDISKECGKAWKTLSDDDKHMWKIKAETLRT